MKYIKPILGKTERLTRKAVKYEILTERTGSGGNDDALKMYS
jgi:hypothetical protein